MISGIPPFQSKSEYMIFKKIEKLDYSFHEGFDEHAKDLVKRLLVIGKKSQTSAPFRIFSGKRQIGKFSILNLVILFSFWQKNSIYLLYNTDLL